MDPIRQRQPATVKGCRMPAQRAGILQPLTVEDFDRVASEPQACPCLYFMDFFRGYGYATNKD
jgi:hypothetical protein